MPDTTITVGVNVENLEEVKELREELEKIRDLKKEIDELGEDETPTFPDIDPDPRDPFPEPENPKRPRFWASLTTEKEETREFDPFNNEDDDNIKAETSFQV